MNGSFTPSSASRSAMLVWVKAPGLKMRKLDPFGARAVHDADELVLGVALARDQAVAQLRGQVSAALGDLLEAVRPVDSRLALTQQIQIRSVEQQQTSHGRTVLTERAAQFNPKRGLNVQLTVVGRRWRQETADSSQIGP